MQEECNTIGSNLLLMIRHLNASTTSSSDPPDVLPPETTCHIGTGRPGRPCIDIDSSILAPAIELRGPTHLASVFGVSAHMVRRHALEYGLVEPGAPVYVDYEGEDRTVTRFTQLLLTRHRCLSPLSLSLPP